VGTIPALSGKPATGRTVPTGALGKRSLMHYHPTKETIKYTKNFVKKMRPDRTTCGIVNNNKIRQHTSPATGRGHHSGTLGTTRNQTNSTHRRSRETLSNASTSSHKEHSSSQQACATSRRSRENPQPDRTLTHTPAFLETRSPSQKKDLT